MTDREFAAKRLAAAADEADARATVARRLASNPHDTAELSSEAGKLRLAQFVLEADPLLERLTVVADELERLRSRIVTPGRPEVELERSMAGGVVNRIRRIAHAIDAEWKSLAVAEALSVAETVGDTYLAAARRLGMKPSEILDVDERAEGLVITTVDGQSYIDVPEDTPDAEGKTGLMWLKAAGRRSGLPVFTPRTS